LSPYLNRKCSRRLPSARQDLVADALREPGAVAPQCGESLELLVGHLERVQAVAGQRALERHRVLAVHAVPARPWTVQHAPAPSADPRLIRREVLAPRGRDAHCLPAQSSRSVRPKWAAAPRTRPTTRPIQ